MSTGKDVTCAGNKTHETGILDPGCRRRRQHRRPRDHSIENVSDLSHFASYSPIHSDSLTVRGSVRLQPHEPARVPPAPLGAVPLAVAPQGLKAPSHINRPYAALKAPLFHGGTSIHDSFRSLMEAARFHGSVSPRATMPSQPTIDGVRNFEYAINQHNPEQRDLIAHKQFLRVQRRIPPGAIGS